MVKFNWKGILFGVIILFVFIIMSLDFNNKVASKEVYLISKSKDPRFEYWQNVKEGAEISAQELGVELIFEGAINEIDVDEQIRLIEKAIEKKPLGIVIAPSDYKRLVPVVEKAIDQGINCVLIDCFIDTDYDISLIGTDNIKGAKIIADEMAKSINMKGKVAIMGHVEGTTTAMERDKGFREAIRRYPDITVVEKTWYSDGIEGKAYREALDILNKHKDINGIFGTNEKTVMGIARAIEERGLKDQISLFGFDGNYEEVYYMEKDILSAVVVQRPFNMGYLGIKTVVEEARNGQKPQYIDTGCKLITKDNLFTPENNKLLFPLINSGSK